MVLIALGVFFAGLGVLLWGVKNATPWNRDKPDK